MATLKDASRPPSPRVILDYRAEYEVIIYERESIRDKCDTSLACLYRLYEHIMLDQNLEMRNHLEYLWFRRWPVFEIPDPCDDDPERAAVLACIPSLLVLAFNARIEMGLPRHAPAIITDEMIEKWRAEPRKYESEPTWAAAMPTLKETLAIPHWDRAMYNFVALPSFESEKASQEFKRKNILIWQPHIYFT